MDLKITELDTKFRLKSLKLFFITFLGVFGVIWLLIEPLGFNTIFGEAVYKTYTWQIYFGLLVVAITIAICAEIINRLIRYTEHMRRMISLIKNQGSTFNNFENQINKKRIAEVLSNIASEGYNEEKLTPYERVFVRNLFIFFNWLRLTATVNNQHKSANELIKLNTQPNVDSDIGNLPLPAGFIRSNKIPLNGEISNYQKQIETTDAETIQTATSSMVLIKARDKNNIDHFLLQYSKSWHGGYYGFIGGIKEATDIDEIAAAQRELNEELGIEPQHISSLDFIGIGEESRASGHLGISTKYQYHVYLLQLNYSDELDYLFKLKNKIALPFQQDQTKHKIKWMSWDELKNDSDLRRDASSVLDLIQEKGIHKSGISTEEKIFE